MLRSFCMSSMYAHWLMLLRPTVIALFLASARGREELKTTGIAEVAIANFYVDPTTGRIQDQSGRERIFHGLNVVMKGPPWHPQVDTFDPQFSFTDADVALLKQWGMNAVRLGVMWPGVEPKRGQVNSTYLNVIQSIVRNLQSAGIYTLLEFHQDVFAAQFCGEGLPSWILDDTDHDSPVRDYQLERTPREDTSVSPASKQVLEGTFVFGKHGQRNSKQVYRAKRYPASFPEPLGKRWPSEWGKDGWEPSVERCNKHTWWGYYFSYAVSRAFQDLYENKWGWGDLLARYWSTVAEVFRNETGVLGYELMNEPWPGDIFRNPALLLPGVADSKNLAGLYDKLQAAVRSVDAEKLLFFETITFDNFRCGLRTVPGGTLWRNKTVLSYHYYTPPNFSVNQAFSERLKESNRLGCGSMLTEFFVSTEHGKQSNRFWELRKNMLERTEVAAEATGGSSPSGLDLAPCDSPVESSDVDCSSDGSSRSKGFDDEPRIVNGDSTGKLFSEGSGRLLANLHAGENTHVERRSDNSVDGVLTAADAHVQSWIGWEYKGFYNKTGSVVELSLFGVDGELNIVLAKKLARTYPRAVCGNIRYFSFDPTTSSFFLAYVAGAKCFDVDSPISAPTEIFVHRDFYYTEGLSVGVNHECASVIETTDLVFIHHSLECFGLVLEVSIDRLYARG